MWSDKRVLVFMAALLAMVAACGPRLRSELFAIDFAAMRRPVMVSRPVQPVGQTVRRIVAETGTKGSLMLRGKTWVERREWALVTGSEVFRALLQDDDRWFQIEGAEFRAFDANGVGAALNERTLTLTGTAHR